MSDILVTLKEREWDSVLTVLQWAEEQHDDSDATTTMNTLRSRIKEQIGE